MSDEDITPTTHCADTADSSPSQENSVHVFNGEDLSKSLDNISNNMGKMACMLAKLYDPGTDERSPSIKRKPTSDLPDFFRLLLRRKLSPVRQTKALEKPNRRQFNLHASGDELDDENGIERLTDRLTAIGQKERETPAKETEFPQDFASSYDEDDATGDEIQKELADVAQKQWDKKLSPEKIKSLVETALT